MRLGRSIIYFRKTRCQGEFGIGNAECGIIWKVEEGEVGKKELFEFGMRNAENKKRRRAPAVVTIGRDYGSAGR